MKLLQEANDILRRSVGITLALYKIMIPIIIGVKILQELELISWLAMPLAPVMHLVGLPGEMGLVWATAMINNVYSGMIVFVSLAGHHDLSVAQVTVLCTMILLAHSLPIELQVVGKSGPRMGFQALLRIGGALVLGWLLSKVYAMGGWLQEPSVLMWHPDPESGSLAVWAAGAGQEPGHGLRHDHVSQRAHARAVGPGITDLCVRLLSPVLRLLGIGPEAGTLTIVGMVMGLSYGGGLIMHEAHSGRVPPKDIFSSLSLMSLSHSVFEDTFLMAVLGGHSSGLLLARVAFTMIVVAALVRLVAWLGDGFFYRRLFRPVEVYAPPGPCCPGARTVDRP